MRIARIFLAIVLTALALPDAFAAVPCREDARAELVRLGYAEPDIRKMCGNALALFERAFKTKESGDLKSAQSLFELGLSIDPSNAMAQGLLSEVKESLGSARRLFEQAYNAKEAGDLQAAEELFEQGLQLDPGNALGQRLLTEVKESRGNAKTLFSKGFEAKQAGDLQSARQLFEQGLTLEPKNQMALNYLAELRQQASRPAGREEVMVSIRKQLELKFPLSQLNADETDVNAVGAVVSLQKDSLVMNKVHVKSSRKRTLAVSNAYENGMIKPVGLVGTLSAFNAILKQVTQEVGQSRIFHPGEKFLVTRIVVGGDGFSFNLLSDPVDNERYSGTLKFRFANGDAPTADQAAALVGQVLVAQ